MVELERNVNPKVSSKPFPALVVDRDGPDAVLAVSALTSVGFTVMLADTFEIAKQLLITHPPLVMVTEVRLGAYNGLQLAIRAAGMQPPVSVIVTSETADAVLQRDAERIGATFVVKPLTTADLIAAVFRTALRRPNADGVVEPVRPPFERRFGDRRAKSTNIIDFERRGTDRRRDVHERLAAATG